MDIEKLQDLDQAHLWHPYTKRSAFKDHPLPIIVRGEGCYLYDAGGNRYLDAISSWWACCLGHSHPRMLKAINKQAAQLQHSIIGNLSHPSVIELSAKLASYMPDPNRHVHYASDGASAVEAALKIALQYRFNRGESQRTKFVSLKNAYHGDTLTTLSLGFIESFHKPFENVRQPVLQLPVPPYDDTLENALQAAEDLFQTQGQEITAMIVEPLCQGAAGMRIYSPDYLKSLFEFCQNHGVLFIADEIAVGFGRTGTRFAFEQAGIDPDLVCLGKALSAGYLPISAVIAKDEIYQTFDDSDQDFTFYHGHTFAGNPIATAAAVECMKIIDEEDFIGKGNTLGKTIYSSLKSLNLSNIVKTMRHLGLIVVVEFSGDQAAVTARKVQQKMAEAGILVRPLGPVIYLMLPFIIEESEALECAETLKKAIIALS